MNTSERDEVFLAEMGIAPLWRLRRPAPGTAQAGEIEAQADASPAVTTLAQAPAASPAAAGPAVVDPAFVPPPPRDPAWGEIPRTSAPAPSPWTPPAPAPVEEPEPADSLEAIARMDWDELHAAIARCERCGSCSGSQPGRQPGRQPVYGSGSRQARWFVAAGAATAADEKAGHPLAGDPGKLFDNMLASVGLSREQDVWVTQLVKCRPASANGGDRAPTSEEAAACRPFLERELALTGAATVLTLGQIAANGLLGKPLSSPLAGSRGQVHAYRAASLVATLHPGELLRRGLDKALAWTDLCRAKGQAQAQTPAGHERDARRDR